MYFVVDLYFILCVMLVCVVWFVMIDAVFIVCLIICLLVIFA